MSYDITNGDILVIGAEEYPIRSVAYWPNFQLSRTFSRLATLTAATKRSPVITGGKIGPPAIKEASITCTPLDPVDPELRQRLALDTPHEVLQTFVADVAGYYHLILEELKR